MSPWEHSRLVNLLMRTASPFDGEALAATRKANEMLRRHKLTWTDVIDTPFVAENPAFPWRWTGKGKARSECHSRAGNAASAQEEPQIKDTFGKEFAMRLGLWGNAAVEHFVLRALATALLGAGFYFFLSFGQTVGP